MRFPLLPPRLFLTAAALCLALCAAPFSASADSDAKPAAATPAATPRPLPFKGVIVSVNATARTFSVGKKVVRQIHVLPETKLTQGDTTAATFETLASGQEVRGSIRQRADGEYDAVSVKIGAKEKPGA